MITVKANLQAVNEKVVNPRQQIILLNVAEAHRMKDTRDLFNHHEPSHAAIQSS